MRFKAEGAAKFLFMPLLTCLSLYLFPFAASSSRQSSAVTQTQSPPSDCPQLYSRIESSQWVGRTVHHTLSAGLTGGTPPKLEITYKWKVTPGTITSGQGSNLIIVEMPECECDLHVLTEAEGLEAGCQKSVEWGINDLCFYPVSTESYGAISAEEEKALLSKYASALRDKCWQMRITAHEKKGDRPGETLARAEQAKQYVVGVHGVEADRIIVVAGEPQEEHKINLLVFHGRFARKEGARP